jgi:uncharacterized protein YegP (UPF0339 family)
MMQRAVAFMGLAIVACLVAGVVAARGEDKKAAFEVYKDKGGEFRWRLRAGSGKILGVPEDAYKAQADARKAAENIKANAATMKADYVVDKAKKHRWNLKARNGRVMARSSEGYETKANAEKALTAFLADAKGATITNVK